MDAGNLKELLSNSRNIVFFGGAGVSTESNIPDFRSEDGIYRTKNKYGNSPEVMLSHTFFINHTKEFYDFYKNNMIFTDAKPNKAHLALAELEKEGRLKEVVTQNIDGLHQLAGSRNVLELHGSVHRNYCMDCGERYGLDYILNSGGMVPVCNKCGGIVRPDVTLYEESLNMGTMESAISFIQKADMLIVGGTSLAVYPAAGLIDYYRGNMLVLINKSATAYDKRADLVINESIGDVLAEAVMNYH
jgi:NAD-dependent deacetylase